MNPIYARTCSLPHFKLLLRGKVRKLGIHTSTFLCACPKPVAWSLQLHIRPHLFATPLVIISENNFLKQSCSIQTRVPRVQNPCEINGISNPIYARTGIRTRVATDLLYLLKRRVHKENLGFFLLVTGSSVSHCTMRAYKLTY